VLWGLLACCSARPPNPPALLHAACRLSYLLSLQLSLRLSLLLVVLLLLLLLRRRRRL
jgi:hypothetical protein